jgi:hypothetical protein
LVVLHALNKIASAIQLKKNFAFINLL